VEQAILRLKGGDSRACLLPQDEATVRGAAEAGAKVLRLATVDGQPLEVQANEIDGLEVEPPYSLVPNFLSADEQEQALAYVMAHEREFHDATISLPSTQGSSLPDYDLRKARLLDNVAGVMPLLMAKLQSTIPKVWPRLGMGLLRINRLECQISVHGDGDFFNTHTDNGLPDIAHRRVSYVCYIHREPKRFTGGKLRLYRTLVQGNENKCGTAAIDIDPPGNGLVVFPSHVYHEVTPIQCSSQVLTDQRLTINGWLI
jgi:Rps23 Pro-64 3,4-dihydroxylase Tpa1-like proline 4-hydroxylase